MSPITNTARNVDTDAIRMSLAAAVWLLGVYLTWLALLATGLSSDLNTEAGQWVAIAAFGIQAVLSLIESRTWRGGATWEAWVALLADMAINYAGLAPYAFPVAAYLARDLPSWGIINSGWIVANAAPFVIAYMVAWVPETLWRDGMRKGGRP